MEPSKYNANSINNSFRAVNLQSIGAGRDGKDGRDGSKGCYLAGMVNLRNSGRHYNLDYSVVMLSNVQTTKE